MTNQSSGSNNESSPSSLSDVNTTSSCELSPTGSLLKQQPDVEASNESSQLSPASACPDHNQLDNSSCSSNNTSREEEPGSGATRLLKRSRSRSRSRVDSQSEEVSVSPPAKVSKIGYSIMNILGPATKKTPTESGKLSNKENSTTESITTAHTDVQQSQMGLLNPLNVTQHQQQAQFMLNPFLAAAAAAAAQGANNNHLLNNISNLALLSGLPGSGGGKPANQTGEFWPWLNMASAMSAFYGLDKGFPSLFPTLASGGGSTGTSSSPPSSSSSVTSPEEKTPPSVASTTRLSNKYPASPSHHRDASPTLEHTHHHHHHQQHQQSNPQLQIQLGQMVNSLLQQQQQPCDDLGFRSRFPLKRADCFTDSPSEASKANENLLASSRNENNTNINNNNNNNNNKYPYDDDDNDNDDDDENLDEDDDDVDDSTNGGDPYDNMRKKKTRTVFSRNQVFQLESTFDVKRYLSSSERSSLANSLQLTETQIKIWFQNRRNKWKRQLAAEIEANTSSSGNTPIQQQQQQQQAPHTPTPPSTYGTVNGNRSLASGTTTATSSASSASSTSSTSSSSSQRVVRVPVLYPPGQSPNDTNDLLTGHGLLQSTPSSSLSSASSASSSSSSSNSPSTGNTPNGAMAAAAAAAAMLNNMAGSQHHPNHHHHHLNHQSMLAAAAYYAAANGNPAAAAALVSSFPGHHLAASLANAAAVAASAQSANPATQQQQSSQKQPLPGVL